jgi:hypothetical protein
MKKSKKNPHGRSLPKILLTIVLLFAGLSSSKATINTWLGGNSGDEALWSEDLNWSLGHVPTSSEDAEIPVTIYDPILDVNTTTHKLFIKGTATLTLDPSYTFTTTGDVTVGNGGGAATLFLAGGAIEVGGNFGGNGVGFLIT